MGAFMAGAMSYYLSGNTTGLIHDFAEKVWNGYIASSASLFSLSISIPVSLIVLKCTPCYSVVINYLAESAFAVYLMSDYWFICNLLWKNIFTFSNIESESGVVPELIIPTFVMAVCLVIDILRRAISNHLRLFTDWSKQRF